MFSCLRSRISDAILFLVTLLGLVVSDIFSYYMWFWKAISALLLMPLSFFKSPVGLIYAFSTEIYFISQKTNPTFSRLFHHFIRLLLLGDGVRPADPIVLYLLMHIFWHKMCSLIWGNIVQYSVLIKQTFVWWCLWSHFIQGKQTISSLVVSSRNSVLFVSPGQKK